MKKTEKNKKTIEPKEIKNMEDLYDDERFKDITLKCMDGEIRAHKAILAASKNKVFETMFLGNFSIGDVIEFPFAKVAWLDLLLKHRIYEKKHFSTKVECIGDTVEELISTYYFAEYFDFTGLKELLNHRFNSIKIDSLTDDQLDAMVTFSSKNKTPLHLKVSDSSVPWLVNKIYQSINNEEKEKKDFLIYSYSRRYDLSYKYILYDQRVTHQLFSELFHYQNFTDEDILSFTERGLLHYRTAYIISRIKSIENELICRKQKPINLQEEEGTPLRYEFDLEIAHYEYEGINHPHLVDFRLYFKNMHHKLSLVKRFGYSRECNENITPEEFYDCAKSTRGDVEKIKGLVVLMTIS